MIGLMSEVGSFLRGLGMVQDDTRNFRRQAQK